MKFFLTAFILIMFVGCQRACKTNEEEVLRIGTNATFIPFESVNEKGQLEGFDIDLGIALGQILKKAVIWEQLEFDALIMALKKNKVDLIISALSILPSRKEEIAMIPYQGEPMTQISFLFWGGIETPINNFEDLKNLCEDKKLKINVQAGHFLEDFLKEKGIPTKPLPGPPEQILDLKYKKSLSAAVDPSNGKKLASAHPEIRVLSLDLPKDKWDLGYGIGIEKSRSDLIVEVTKAIESLKADGTIKRLEEKWLSQ